MNNDISEESVNNQFLFYSINPWQNNDMNYGVISVGEKLMKPNNHLVCVPKWVWTIDQFKAIEFHNKGRMIWF